MQVFSHVTNLHVHHNLSVGISTDRYYKQNAVTPKFSNLTLTVYKTKYY